MSEGNPQEQVTVTDKRRVDPETGEVRHVPPGDTPGGTPPAGADSSAAKVAELTADLQRVQADFANYRKRALRDQQAAADRAKASVVSELLHAVDDIERARKHGDLDSGPLKAVADKMMSVLTGLGLKSFGAEGEDFDPVLHEAVQHEGDGGQDAKPVIGTVMRQGYQLGEHVLRNALVAVVETIADATSEAGSTQQLADSGEAGRPDTADNADAPAE
ncbi:nucleotide exchange factor GrpE [Mycobacterium marinum]|uniref:nucleotide exchange factor GrpE n=1 Tax=Mycobacterium marinum TaxID=1781 RepID=UPI0023596852|nr:nucleotide exchange factor GrpE [Mycobacterium marinum]MDC8981011.1 nucleotide exchange factor GrpE [Mycobacterium marinum]MDC8999321.1 nucleotide exchange factor GrpE [Mycobacterium marinum]MDC9009892.1 nucleotide exchange factor GrpE [Mycobacterium marinum]MDC9015758.1 nucleotide exchange factor GrpE [Mycobacterium marinum]